MESPLLLLLQLLFLHLGVGRSSAREEHYIGQQHNPQHDMNVLLGDEDSEQIKKLSPAEQKRKIVGILKKIDTDGDNLLSAEELTSWIQHVYRTYALDDAKERFPEFDTDQDGFITWEEYNQVAHNQLISFEDSAALDDPEQESLRYANVLPPQLHLKEKRRFNFADQDGSSGLNVTEFLAFTHPSEVDHMAEFTIEDVLAEYDLDKDEFISLNEFIGDVRGEGESPSQWEVEETVRFKDLYDQDNDGRLNREEQLRWVAPNSYGSAREEALHLLKEIDQDGDGRISQTEVFKNQETFLNSEVTDYGRQLHISHDEL